MDQILERIEGPADLKRLNPSELEQLAGEIRQLLVETVTANGGHLASNLGAVELTIALHRIFDSPQDKIVWDVGHQAYVHKLLTGRRLQFATIRQYGGLSGFPEPAESSHDAFGTGHASTSISAALGMAVARDRSGQNYHAVAVIGDGALTGGMALEAMNHAGHLGSRLIVILNDNQMSISPNVGAIARVLNRVRLAPRYHRAKEGAEQWVSRLPLGRPAWRIARRLKDTIKGLIIPTIIWEELGFTYIGPIDGHDIGQLEQALAQAKAYPTKPTFIHVITTKGKGHPPAEEDAIGFHGVAPNGFGRSLAPTYTKVFSETVFRLMRDNPQVVAITAAMLEGTGLALAAAEFPGRVFDVGICEQHGITFAAGLATQGFKPIVAIYSTFLQRAYDQILHDVCLQKLPVVFALDRGGIVGEDGKTHQGLFDLSYLRSAPGLVVASPRDENELQHLLYTALHCDQPMAIRFPRGYGMGVARDEILKELPIGQGERLRPGADATIVALGSTVFPALEAAALLAKEGAECQVIDARYLKPLDEALILEAARATEVVVTAEENVLSGGLGSVVAELLADQGLCHVRMLRLGIPDQFVEHGPQEVLRAKYGLDGPGIATSIRQAFPELVGRRLLLERKR